MYMICMWDVAKNEIDYVNQHFISDFNRVNIVTFYSLPLIFHTTDYNRHTLKFTISYNLNT